MNENLFKKLVEKAVFRLILFKGSLAELHFNRTRYQSGYIAAIVDTVISAAKLHLDDLANGDTPADTMLDCKASLEKILLKEMESYESGIGYKFPDDPSEDLKAFAADWLGLNIANYMSYDNDADVPF